MKVLFADDDSVMRLSITRYLTLWGHDPVTLSDGAAAYAYLHGQEEPCLAILDWMMPDMDGVDICRALRQRQGGPFIYTILLTARTEKADLLEGLEAGAQDFLRKPFDPDELRSRLVVGERIIRYERESAENSRRLEHYAREMESIADARAKQLLQADRMATLGLMFAGLAHEIGNVLTYIGANAGELRQIWPEIEAALRRALAHESDADAGERLRLLLQEAPDILAGIEHGMERASAVVRGLKGYSRRDDASLRKTPIQKIVQDALELCRNRLKTKVLVEECIAENLPEVLANEQRLLQVLVNLFINAADAMGDKQGACLRVSAGTRDGKVAVSVEDNGPGLPPDKLDAIWEPFYTTKSADKGTGLGLSICRTIVEEHHGAIVAENREEGGARFIISLPKAPPDQTA